MFPSYAEPSELKVSALLTRTVEDNCSTLDGSLPYVEPSELKVYALLTRTVEDNCFYTRRQLNLC